MAGGGFLALAALGVLSALASGASSSPPARRALPAPRQGPFHWHVTWTANTRYYFENVGRSHDGDQEMRCPFCHQEYVKRPRRR
jgi:hypothetical protein